MNVQNESQNFNPKIIPTTAELNYRINNDIKTVIKSMCGDISSTLIEFIPLIYCPLNVVFVEYVKCKKI